MLLGVCAGLILAIIKYMANHMERNIILTVLNWIANIYIAIIRGTPVYVQLLIMYFVIFSKSDLPPIVSAIICFGINSSAYVAEIIRAGIEAVDAGQMEAGRSLGLGWTQTMLSIIMPQAIKNILPALGNEFIVLIKETAVVGTITVLDVTRAAQNVAMLTFEYLPPLLITAAMYLVVVIILTNCWVCSKGGWHRVIDVKNLNKKFGENHVLKDINEHIEKGEKVVIVGPSGSGKSTFLRCLNLMERPTSGHIIVEGQDITTAKSNEINQIRRKMGMVFQHFNLFPHLTIIDNITLAPVKLKLMTKEEARLKAVELLKRVGLEDKANAYPGPAFRRSEAANCHYPKPGDESGSDAF